MAGFYSAALSTAPALHWLGLSPPYTLEAQLAQNLLRIAQGYDRQALIATIFALKSRFGWVEAALPPAPRERELGKKEAAMQAAHSPPEDLEWEELLSHRAN
jgi:hypothetical protein